MDSALAQKSKSGLDTLSSATGLSKEALLQTFEEVRQNHAKLRACTRHQFDTPPQFELGKRHTCKNCGGTMSGERIAHYEEGVRHAGSPFEVWT